MLTNAQALETLLAAEPSHIEEDEEEYGLLEDEQVVLVRAYGDDGDDQLLAEIRPRYIVMVEPNMDFVRRIEVSLIFPSYTAFPDVFTPRCIAARALDWPFEFTL